MSDIDDLYNEFMATDKSKKSWDLTVGLRFQDLTTKARIDELENWTYCGAEADEIKERIAQLKEQTNE